MAKWNTGILFAVLLLLNYRHILIFTKCTGNFALWWVTRWHDNDIILWFSRDCHLKWHRVIWSSLIWVITYCHNQLMVIFRRSWFHCEVTFALICEKNRIFSVFVIRQLITKQLSWNIFSGVPLSHMRVTKVLYHLKNWSHLETRYKTEIHGKFSMVSPNESKNETSESYRIYVHYSDCDISEHLWRQVELKSTGCTFSVVPIFYVCCLQN